MIEKIVAIDPGVHSGIAEFVIREEKKIAILRKIHVYPVNEMHKYISFFLDDTDLVILERFVNPYSKLTKDAITTIEMCGAVKHETYICEVKLITCVQSQKEGYISFAKELLDDVHFEGKQHCVDAVAHGLRYCVKTLKMEVGSVECNLM